MKCTKCKAEKDESDFAFRNKNEGKRSTYCKECGRKYVKQHYLNNKKYYLDKARKYDEVHVETVREFIWNYLLSHPCVDCGESDPIVLEFDHVRSKKENSIGIMMVRKNSLDVVCREVEKCDVRCSNCHKRKTAFQFNTWKTKRPVGETDIT